MNSKVLAESILKLVGGEGNVSALVHCSTIFLFKINYIVGMNIPKLEALDGVITVVRGAGQLQVVIGNRVPEVYREFGTISSLLNDSRDSAPVQTQDKNGTALGRLVDVISAIFTPLLGAMAAAGVLKGLLSIAVALGWRSTQNSSYIILQAASDSLFYFLPMLLAITSARKFGANVFVAVSLAGALVYPSIQGLFDAGGEVTFFGIPVVVVKYTTSVIPIILSVWLMSYLERFINRHIHESVRNILTPFVLLAVMVPLTLMTVGPLGISVSKVIATVFVTIYGFNPIITSALFAALWQVFVIFGVHWGFVTLFINDLVGAGTQFLESGHRSGGIFPVRRATGGDDPRPGQKAQGAGGQHLYRLVVRHYRARGVRHHPETEKTVYLCGMRGGLGRRGGGIRTQLGHVDGDDQPADRADLLRRRFYGICAGLRGGLYRQPAADADGRL